MFNKADRNKIKFNVLNDSHVNEIELNLNYIALAHKFKEKKKIQT